jgi:hypothetical protein
MNRTATQTQPISQMVIMTFEPPWPHGALRRSRKEGSLINLTGSALFDLSDGYLILSQLAG